MSADFHLRPPPAHDEFEFRPVPPPRYPGPGSMDPFVIMRMEREEREAREERRWKKEKEEREALEREKREAKEERRWKMEMEEKRLERERREAREKEKEEERRWKMEMEEKRLEREERRWKEEMEERRLDREEKKRTQEIQKQEQEFRLKLEEEKEKMRVELLEQLGVTEGGETTEVEQLHTSTPTRVSDQIVTPALPLAPPVLHMPIYNANESIDTYIEHFEAVADVYHLSEDLRAMYLMGNLTGKAKEAFVNIPSGATYAELKAALRRRLQMSPETYRKQFRNMRKSSDETFHQFGERLKKTMNYWLESSGMETKDCFLLSNVKVK